MRKKDLIQISNTFESCQNEIALQVAEIKSIENSMQANSSSRTQIREYRLQMKASEDKVKKLSKDLWNYTKLLIYCERDVLKHLAGVMKM